MREELVFMNPARLATLPTAPASRNRPWSADEARRFLTVAWNDPLYTDSDSDSQRDALTRMSDRLFGQAGA
jgi:hypothetical protein